MLPVNDVLFAIIIHFTIVHHCSIEYHFVPEVMKRGPPPPRPPTKPGQNQNQPRAGADSNDPNWIEKFTADKVAYYYNTATESVSWDKPNSLKTADEKERDQGEWVWVSDEKEAWMPAMVKSRSGENVSVVSEE